MSLLMEALRKAEHAKRNKETPSEGAGEFERQEPVLPQSGASSPDSEPTLEPLEIPFETPTHAPAPLSEEGLAFDAGTASTDSAPMSMELQDMEPAASREPAVDAPAPPAPLPVQEADAVRPAVGRGADAPAAVKVEQAAAPAARAGMASNPDLKAEQRQAKAVFSSKEKSPLRRTSFVVAAAIVICAALAVYGYYQLDKLGGGSVVANLPAPAPAAPAPVTTAVPDATAPQEAPAAPAAPAVAETAVPSAFAAQEAAPARGAISPAPAAAPIPAPQATTDTAAGNPPPADAAAKPKPPQKPPVDVRVVRNAPQDTVNPLLTAAYDAFVAGDLDAAAKSYRAVLRQDANDRDALLGLAVIAVRRGHDEEAEAFYGRLLELDPRDADAIAGMAELRRGDSGREESRLKTALVQHPQSGPILFALGNLYAQRSNWPEAQQYYFRAYGTQPNNAGYAFNLAVSLDRLSQPKLAIQYYEAALSGVQSEPLDAAAIRRRITTLKGAVAP